MKWFLLRRLGGAVFVLLALSVVVYAAFYVAPGNVAQIACGPRCSPAQVAQVSEQLHLGDPLYLQYAHFLQGSSPAATTRPGPACCTARRPAWGSRTRATSRSPS